MNSFMVYYTNWQTEINTNLLQKLDNMLNLYKIILQKMLLIESSVMIDNYYTCFQNMHFNLLELCTYYLKNSDVINVLVVDGAQKVKKFIEKMILSLE